LLAYQVVTWGEEPVLNDVRVPEPGPGEVLVRIAAAGACHSDLHIIEAREPRAWPLPMTLGHENTGWIEKLGAGVGGWEVGEPVAVYGPWGCGRCRQCRRSAENNCERAAQLPYHGGGVGLDGGMAEFMLIPSERLLVRLGDLDPILAAPLTDAGLTPYHAIKRALPVLVGGSSAVVIGVGGLGHMALQLLRTLTPAYVIAVDTSPEKLEQATRHGANAIVQAGPGAAAEVLARTGPAGATYVLDLVGAEPTVELAGKLSSRGGEVSIVGLGGAELGVGFRSVASDCTVVSPYWGTAVELSEVLSLARAGRIKPEIERFALTDVATAYDRMRAGTLGGRAVIVPD
jgi:alcohol dehydrogenase, propanol-preferring